MKIVIVENQKFLKMIEQDRIQQPKMKELWDNVEDEVWEESQ